MKKADATGSCPQCGAPVNLNIGDPLLSCSFCRTKLYMLPPAGIFSYFLTPLRRPDPGHDICFLPYWRFRGFKIRLHRKKQTECSVVDTTVPASDIFSGLPMLGMAPQLGDIRLSPDPPAGLSLLNSPRKALKKADAQIEALLPDKPVMEGIIGENSSIIQAPFEVIDQKSSNTPLLRPLWGAKGIIRIDRKQKEAITGTFMKPQNSREHIRFLPMICPECGNDLPAFPRATALLCRFCNRIWGIGGSRLFPKRFSITAESICPDMIFLPFWHFNTWIRDFPADNRYAFYRALFPYRQAPEIWKKEPVQIVIPAFKINPRLFLKLSTRMSKTGIPFPARPTQNPQVIPSLHMVNFTMEEAAHSIRIVLCDLFGHKKGLRDRVQQASIRLKGSRMVLLPFRKGGREYVEVHSGQAIPVAAVELGARL